MRFVLLLTSLVLFTGCFPWLLNEIDIDDLAKLAETKAGQSLNEKLSEYWTGKMVWPKRDSLKGAWSNVTFSGFCLVTAIETDQKNGSVLLAPGDEKFTAKVGNTIFNFKDEAAMLKFNENVISFHEKALFHLYPADKLHLIEEPDPISHDETNLFRFSTGHLIAFSSEEAKKKALNTDMWPKLFVAWLAIWEDKAWGKPLDDEAKNKLLHYFDEPDEKKQPDSEKSSESKSP